FPGFIWDIPNRDRTIYLTFDDGPTPEITEWVLDLLKQHDIKATFFCIGNNIANNPDIFKKVIAGGHAIGNHTYNHLNGWKNSNEAYFENINACEKEIALFIKSSTMLFRPPYGKIRTPQAREARK